MKENILYFECNSGISGDMTVAALLDLGADRQTLLDALASLPLTGFSIEIKDVFKSGIRSCDFNVVLDQDNHDHDMNYLHGDVSDHTVTSACAHTAINTHTHQHLHDDVSTYQHPQEETFTHQHSQEDIATHLHSQEDVSAHPHSHGEALTHQHPLEDKSAHQHVHDNMSAHTHHHDARNLSDITHIIQAGNLTETARELALRIFRILAESEAFVHGKSIDEVHFHEVGAVDSIVDIVAAAVCLDNLHPDRVVFSPLTEGCGQIRCQHGLIPVPVPAVTAIAMKHGLILKTSAIEGELVTPTGAAIAAAFSNGNTLPEQYRICKMGFGAGKRDYATTGLLRAMLIEPVTEPDTAGEISLSDDHDTILTLETNIDDCTGEALAHTMHLLFEAGALDVFYLPVYMKKNRPAWLLKVICTESDREKMEHIIFCNTTTIGIRRQTQQRTRLERRILAVETPWGIADIKCCTHNGETYFYPENDSISRLSQSSGIGFSKLYSMVQVYVQNTVKQ